MRTMPPEEVREMLTAAARHYGMDFEELRELSVSGRLIEPELRDLWLIWGEVAERSSARSA